MAKSFGWAGTILAVDLSTGKITKTPTTDYHIQEFIGGLGFNTRIFWDMGCPEVAAFDPANPIIISAGPLAGTYGPFGRAEVCSISPQSYPQENFSYSSIGGRFPSEMKYAGYDGIIITGKAKEPVYLSINDAKVEIKSAADAWGLDTFESQQVIRTSEPGSSVLVIGPAGENLSRIAVILSDTKFAAGEGGFGAVMGAKNLKAISVKGSGTVAVARPEEFLKLIKIIKDENKKIGAGRMFRLPYTSPDPVKKLYETKYYINQTGCTGCPQQCHSVNYLPGLGLSACSCANWTWSPGYSNDSKDIWEANLLLQRLGINSIEFLGGLSLFLQLAHKAGILPTEEIEEVMGLPATKWLGGTATDHKFLNVLLHKIADGEFPYKEGTSRIVEYFSNKLSHGEEVLYKYKEVQTARGYAYHHLDNLGSGLHWATDTRDPVDSCHEYKFNTPESLAHFGLPPYSSYQILDLTKTVYEGAEKIVAWVQENQSIKNSLPVCEFWSSPRDFFYPPDMDLRILLSKLFTAVTGIDMDTRRLAKAGERIWNLRRAIMVKRENRKREDDVLNNPYFEKTIECFGGSAMGQKSGPIDRAKFDKLKDRYYELRGWDTGTGWPTKAKLAELGLKDVADKLTASGKLLQ